MPKRPNLDDPPPVPPVRPDSYDCCRGGCNPCVFDLYEDAMARYRAALLIWEEGKRRKKAAPSASGN